MNKLHYFLYYNYETLIRIASIILIIGGVGCYITGCIIYRYKDGTGVVWFISTLVLMLLAVVNSDFTGLGLLLLFIMFVLFGMLKFHIQPTVTECTKLSNPSGKVIYELKDARVFCSPIDSTCVFTLIGNDTVIARSSKCIFCKKSYDEHHCKIMTKEQWERHLENQAVLEYMKITPQNL